MRIVVMGSGGVDGYLGARLALAGLDVRFLARGAHLAAIRANGLLVESALGDIHALLEACRRAGIDAEISRDIGRSTWEKFVFLVGLSGTTAALRRPIGAIRSNPQTRAFLLDAMSEIVSADTSRRNASPSATASRPT
jgi:ketopantoate reductase